MKRLLAIGALAMLVMALVATPAAAGKKHSKVKGHVIKVEQQVRTANGGVSDRLTIRTRQGEEMQLHLGEGGACEGCFQEGDRVRARIQNGEGSAGQCNVESMKVRRGGEMYGYVNSGGKMVQAQGGRYGAGGAQLHDRQHEPGSGNCAGCQAGRRGGPGQRTGAGGGGGGRGGGGGGAGR